MTDRTTPLRHVVRRVGRQGFVDEELLSVYRDYGVIRKRDRDDNFNKPSEDLSQYRLVEPGNLVLNKMKTWQGSLGVSPYRGIVSPAYFVCELTPDVVPRFIHHLLRSPPLISQYAARSQGIRPNQWDLPWDQFASIEVRLPSIGQQSAIADFLDRECARIDELIAATERVDSLRVEAYERFLRDEVGAEDHEWVQIRRVADTGTGHTPSRNHPEWWIPEECVIPWFTLADVWQIRGDETERVHETAELVSPDGVANSSAVVHPAGTVLLSRTASVGFSAVMDTDMAVSQDFMTWTCGPKLSPEYLLYALRAIRPELRQLMYGSTHKTIYMPDLLSLKIPLPSRAAQDAAVVRIRSGLSTQWAFRAEATGLRNQLSEYRDALITEAVTGKLDVSAVSEARMSDNLAAVRDGTDPEVLA